MKKEEERKFELAPQVETDLRKRESQLLINIAEPDPEYQRFILTDDASIFDAVGTDETVIKQRMGILLQRPRVAAPPAFVEGRRTCEEAPAGLA